MLSPIMAGNRTSARDVAVWPAAARKTARISIQDRRMCSSPLMVSVRIVPLRSPDLNSSTRSQCTGGRVAYPVSTGDSVVWTLVHTREVLTVRPKSDHVVQFDRLASDSSATGENGKGPRMAWRSHG